MSSSCFMKRTGRRLLLIPVVLCLVAALVGLPFVPVMVRGGDDSVAGLTYAFARAVREWASFPGWRYSTESVYWVAVAAAGVLWICPGAWKTSPIRIWWVSGSALLGPTPTILAIPHLLDVRWSNYDSSSSPDGGSWWAVSLPSLAMYVFGGVVVAVRQRTRRSRLARPGVRKSLDRPESRSSDLGGLL
jgi:hypothetical protein